VAVSAQKVARKILIVEDDAFNLELLSDMLELAGHNVVTTSHGADVLDTMGREKPALVLMDIQLPDIDGYEITRLIRADRRFRSVPVLALTAFAMPGDREDAMAAGCTDYVSKPITDMKRFVATVDRYLSDGAPTDNDSETE
jgi:two-component system cell cycle response regulator DivK